ncbi:interaptin-like [Diorhabda carinulata]|uniref:interaptin-like n=1 Tax=Diorhabda carinulata TaxID=1163345 RepID=UPI0025A30051|nr:interaptin-like [Diorhabda carinulata]
MTTSRVIRGTRAKVFLYICAILIIVGIVACYNNTLSQLDDVKKANDICHQQEENLSTQLQVISDYKQRLEKSLKSEQSDHHQIKLNLENQLKEERSKYENEANDMKLKLGSVQQHLNLLQTQYDDYKEEMDKSQKQQQEEIGNLEARISELLEEQKKLRSSRENLKLQFDQLVNEKDKLEKQIQNKHNNEELKSENAVLKQELEQLKEKCNNQDTIPEPKISETGPKPQSDKESKLAEEAENKLSDTNVLHPPPNDSNIPLNQPLNMKQELPVLPEPINDNGKIISSSTSSNNKILKPSQASLNLVRPIFLPTVTPETVKEHKLPKGVVAVPEKKEEEIINARYQNAKDSANELAHREKIVKEELEKENVAHEVFDAPLHQDGLQFDNNDQFKQAEKPNFDKKHIDTLGRDKKNYDQDQAEYKDLQNDVQLEENDDDDGDGYDDHLERQKEPAVRN